MMREVAIRIEHTALHILDDAVTDEARLLASITLILLETVIIDDD